MNDVIETSEAPETREIPEAPETREAPETKMPTLAETIEALRAGGARVFDPPGFDLVASLASKADALGGAAGERLRARALERAARLAVELAKGREKAEAALATFVKPPPGLTQAVAQGAFGVVHRAARRASRRDAHADSRQMHNAWIARLEAKARARGLKSRSLQPLAWTSHEAHAHALATTLYAASRTEALATLIAMRAQAERPDVAGPYNPQALSAAALAELATVSPTYLAALVAQLLELGAFMQLPPVPVVDLRPPPAPRSSAKKRKSVAPKKK